MVTNTSTFTTVGTKNIAAPYLAPSRFDLLSFGPAVLSTTLGTISTDGGRDRKVRQGTSSEVIVQPVAGSVQSFDDVSRARWLVLEWMLEHGPGHRPNMTEGAAPHVTMAVSSSSIPLVLVQVSRCAVSVKVTGHGLARITATVRHPDGSATTYTLAGTGLETSVVWSVANSASSRIVAGVDPNSADLGDADGQLSGSRSPAKSQVVEKFSTVVAVVIAFIFDSSDQDQWIVAPSTTSPVDGSAATITGSTGENDAVFDGHASTVGLLLGTTRSLAELTVDNHGPIGSYRAAAISFVSSIGVGPTGRTVLPTTSTAELAKLHLTGFRSRVDSATLSNTCTLHSSASGNADRAIEAHPDELECRVDRDAIALFFNRAGICAEVAFVATNVDIASAAAPLFSSNLTPGATASGVAGTGTSSKGSSTAEFGAESSGPQGVVMRGIEYAGAGIAPDHEKMSGLPRVREGEGFSDSVVEPAKCRFRMATVSVSKGEPVPDVIVGSSRSSIKILLVGSTSTWNVGTTRTFYEDFRGTFFRFESSSNSSGVTSAQILGPGSGPASTATLKGALVHGGIVPDVIGTSEFTSLLVNESGESWFSDAGLSGPILVMGASGESPTILIVSTPGSAAFIADVCSVAPMPAFGKAIAETSLRPFTPLLFMHSGTFVDLFSPRRSPGESRMAVPISSVADVGFPPQIASGTLPTVSISKMAALAGQRVGTLPIANGSRSSTVCAVAPTGLPIVTVGYRPSARANQATGRTVASRNSMVASSIQTPSRTQTAFSGFSPLHPCAFGSSLGRSIRSARRATSRSLNEMEPGLEIHGAGREMNISAAASSLRWVENHGAPMELLTSNVSGIKLPERWEAKDAPFGIEFWYFLNGYDFFATVSRKPHEINPNLNSLVAP
jgi:hypothetical protein